jgi:hypothetical protein
MCFVPKWIIIFQGVSSKSLVGACLTECCTSEDFVLLGYEAASLELLKMKKVCSFDSPGFECPVAKQL